MKSLFDVELSGAEEEEKSIELFMADPFMDLKKKPEEEDGLPFEHTEQEEADPWMEREKAIEEEWRVRLEQAEKILDNARVQAEAIEKEAEIEGQKAGYEKGFAEGTAAAYAQYQAEYKQQIDSVKHTIRQYVQDMENAKEKVMEEYIDDLKDISLAVAEKIIHTSLKSSGDIVKRMIIAATEKLKKASWAKIYVGKNDAGMTIQGDTELLRELSSLSDNIKIIVMEEEEPGTCIVELPNEIIDLSAATQLENVKDILNNAKL